MDAVLLDLGFLKIYWYSVLILIAIIVGGYLALRESKKWGIPEDFMINMFFFLIPISLIGARLYFVIFHWDYYSVYPNEIIKVWEGGLAIHGAIIAGLLWILFYTKKYKVNTRRILDIAVVSVIIGQAIGRWGNFFNKEAHGGETSLEALSWLPNFIIEGMYIDGTYYEPTFLYESLWCILGFILLLIIRKIKYLKLGQLTSCYLIWYGLGRFIIEGFRTDSLMLGNIKMAQLISITMIIIGIITFIIFQKYSKKYKEKENVNEIRF